MNKTVFIIDDDPLFRMIIERMMGTIDSSLAFIPCDNGEEGLSRLKDHLHSSSECIILLDLNMPVLDGWGFLDSVQSNPQISLENIELYILSSSTDKSDIERSKQYSCVRKFYCKPLNKNDIMEILNVGNPENQ